MGYRMVNGRPRWVPDGPVVRPPQHVPDWSQPQAGAVVPQAQVPLTSAEDLYYHRVPIPFDLVSIIAAPASGTVSTLVGSSTTPAVGPPTPYYRGVVDGIFPYVEGAAGPVTNPRIAGQGVTITWSI